jgi:hypothetical protein
MAGDYQATKDICSKLGFYKDNAGHQPNMLYTPVLPNEIRHCTLLAGVTEIGLGNLDAGIGMLKALEHDMLERPVITDWYWLLLLEWSLADALLRSGDSEQARVHADRVVERSDQTVEVTWRAMAREVRCRVAIEEGDLQQASRVINEALQIIEMMGAPMADWRVHRTAARLHRVEGDNARALLHEQLSNRQAQRLLDSLPPGHRLQDTFARLIA